MAGKLPEIVVDSGPLAGRRFAVDKNGLRLGRSSSCEISIPDPALSRSHCLFEARGGELFVTDLASANGTEVNGAPLGDESRRLAPGDRVAAGDSVLRIEGEGGETAAAPAPEETGKVDLGLTPAAPETEPPRDHAKSAGPRRAALLAALAVAIAALAAAILHNRETAPEDNSELRKVPAAPDDSLHAIWYEKVDATAKGIFRYALEYGADGTLKVELDEVPGGNRKVRKAAQLDEKARRRLAAIMAAPALYNLEREYTGEAAKPNTLKSFSLRVARAGRVFSTAVENTQEPPAFREVREKLETFSKNELGIWAIQFSADKLIEMSEQARRTADSRWEERDVQHGNLALALKGYREAIYCLETVNPKPEGYARLIERRDEAAAEMDRRYRDQRFRADRAINLGDWETARRELQALRDMIADPKDARHAEASAKLLDVETRLSKGGAR